MLITAQEIVRRYGGKAFGNHAKIPTPGHGAKDDGTTVTIIDGGRDVLVYCHNKGGDRFAIRRDILQKFNVTPEDKPRRENTPPKVTAFAIAPPNAPRCAWKHPQYGRPTTTYPYCSQAGELMHYVYRWDVPGEPKQILPISWCELEDGMQAWKSRGPPIPTPLYRLDQLVIRPDATILLVEGEKCAEAAATVFGNGVICMTWSGGSNSWRKADFSPLHGRNIVMWPDNDDAGREAMDGVGAILEAGGCYVDIVFVRDRPAGWDIADGIATGEDMSAYVKENLRAWAPNLVQLDTRRKEPDWRIFLRKSTRTELPIANLANAAVFLRHDPAVADAFAYDELACSAMLVKAFPGLPDPQSIPRPLRDDDVTTLQIWLQGQEGMERVPEHIVRAAMELRARERSYHPIKDWLRSLVWDGKPRVNEWLATYLGAEPSPYVTAIGTMFLVAMIARIFEPGCKADYMLILEGKQGTLKSSACRVLGGNWFSDHLPDVSHKDVSMHLRGRWLIEVAEMHAMSRADQTAMKSFITRPIEQYRPSHGRKEVQEPRQCVMVGTTNQQLYLRDETGERRYWPVLTGVIDISKLEEDRDQLFAEALHLYQNGHKWWPDNNFEFEHIVPQQDARRDPDVWDDVIEDFVAFKKRVTIREIGTDCLGLDIGKFGRIEANRIAACLVKLGWTRFKSDGVKYFIPP